MNLKISLIGYGNLGKALHSGFHGAGLKFHQILSRSTALLHQDVERIYGLNELEEADVYLLAVNDDALKAVSKELDPKIPQLHFSGATGVGSLGSQKAGVAWPMHSFGPTTKTWKGIPVFITAQDEDLKGKVLEIFNRLESEVHLTTDRDRQRMHLAATLVNNFSNYFYRMAKEVIEETSIDFSVFKSLAEGTVEKAFELGPIAAQTGPAKRNDQATLNLHKTFLKDPELNQAYTLISNLITKTHEQNI